jgi:hypothetical protein
MRYWLYIFELYSSQRPVWIDAPCKRKAAARAELSPYLLGLRSQESIPGRFNLQIRALCTLLDIGFLNLRTVGCGAEFLTSSHKMRDGRHSRARTFKCVWGPGIDAKE